MKAVFMLPALGAPPDRITTNPTWSTSNNNQRLEQMTFGLQPKPGKSYRNTVMLPTKRCHAGDEIAQSINPHLSAISRWTQLIMLIVLRLTSQGYLCMVPFNWLDLLTRGPTNNHCWGHSSTPIIMHMTARPDWQAMAHDCRAWFQTNRHFPAKFWDMHSVAHSAHSKSHPRSGPKQIADG